MNAMIITYTLYLILSLLLTVWVARTLHRNGRIFLVAAFRGNAALAAPLAAPRPAHRGNHRQKPPAHFQRAASES